LHRADEMNVFRLLRWSLVLTTVGFSTSSEICRIPYTKCKVAFGCKGARRSFRPGVEKIDYRSGKNDPPRGSKNYAF